MVYKLPREDEPKFYLVWNVQYGPPIVKHASKNRAEEEAERLCKLFPSQKFYVVEAIAVARKPQLSPASRLIKERQIQDAEDAITNLQKQITALREELKEG